jgi:hypothetical protein
VIAERRVAAHLRRYGAVSSAKPMGYAPGRRADARALIRLRAADVVKGPANALWLDESAWREHRARRRKRALVVLAVGAVGASLAALTTLRG